MQATMRAHNELEESGEARNHDDTDEMEHPRICTRHDHVPGRMREEGRSAATPATPLTDGSHSLALGESEYTRPGPIDNADLADHKRDRRQHRRYRPSRPERLASGYSGRLNHLPSHRQGRRRDSGRYRSRNRQLRSRTAANNFERYGRGTLLAKRKGHLLRFRQVRGARGPARLAPGRCTVPATTLQDSHHDRGTLRRARLDRI